MDLVLPDDEGARRHLVFKFVKPAKVALPGRDGTPHVDPVFEYKLLGWCEALGLPAALPVGTLQHAAVTAVLYWKVPGHTTQDPDFDAVCARHGRRRLRARVAAAIAEIRPRYEACGIGRREWEMSDMVFRCQPDGSTTVVPIDWEHTLLDWPRLDASLGRDQRPVG